MPNPTLPDFLASLSPDARARVLAANPSLQPRTPVVEAGHRAGKTAAIAEKARRASGDYKSLTEQHYAAHLEARRVAGEILSWSYESITFRLSAPGQPACRYTPDFYVVTCDHQVELHETKGYMRDDARVKLLWVGQQLPPGWTLVLVTWDRAAKAWKFDDGFSAKGT